MSLIKNIMDSYFRPSHIFSTMYSDCKGESTALAFLSLGCCITFLSNWPVLMRRSLVENQPLEVLLGGALLAWLFLAPLLFYFFAWLLSIILKIIGFQARGLFVRLTLFWGFLASTPILLIFGLVGGYIGDGLLYRVIGVLYWIALIRFIFIGLSVTQQSER